MARTTRSRTSSATATSPSSTDSRGSWLIPPAQRTNSIAAGRSGRGRRRRDPRRSTSSRTGRPCAATASARPPRRSGRELDGGGARTRSSRSTSTARAWPAIRSTSRRSLATPLAADVVGGVADVEQTRLAGDDVRRAGLDVAACRPSRRGPLGSRPRRSTASTISAAAASASRRPSMGSVPACPASPRTATSRASGRRSRRRPRREDPRARAPAPARCAPRGSRRARGRRPRRALGVAASCARTASRERDPVAIDELEPRGLEEARVGGRAEKRGAEARALLVGERDDLDGRGGLSPPRRESLDDGDARRASPSGPSNRPGVRDGVEVRAEDERRSPAPYAPDHVADRIAPRPPAPPPPSTPTTSSPACASAGVANRRVRRSGSSLIAPSSSARARTSAAVPGHDDEHDNVPRACATLYANGWVVTMDDAGTRARRRLGARRGRARSRPSGAGEEPAHDDARRPRRRRRHARPRQHAPPPLPDPHARAGPAGRPLHVAPRALPGLGADRRRGGVRGGAHRARGARALGLLDGLRPPLRLPARPARGSSRRRCRRRASSACGSSPRAARWTSASRTAGLPPDELVEELDARARGDRAAPRRAPRGRPGRAGPDRRRAVLAVLRHAAG